MAITTSGGITNFAGTYFLPFGQAGGLDGTGTAFATTLVGGSTLTVGALNPATSITFSTLTVALGSAVVVAGGSNTIGNLVSTGGAITIDPATVLSVNGLGNVTAPTNFILANGGTLVFGPGVGLSQLENVNFTGSAGTLILDATGLSVNFGTGLVGFGPGDSLGIANANFDPSLSSYDPVSGTLKLFNTGTGAILAVRLTNNPSLSSGEYFEIVNTPTGALISLSAVQGTGFAACYAKGTRVTTTAGEAAVEDLRIGDLLVTASGAARPIQWIGRRSYGGRFLAANASLQPVVIAQGALGGGLPLRDLLVSPNHAMLIDGVLIPAGSLVDHQSITRARQSTVDYFHVELESHDAILAEGAPSETFIDDDSRGMFQNAHEHAAAFPNAGAAPAVFCAQRVEHGPAVDAVRRRIAALARTRADAA